MYQKPKKGLRIVTEQLQALKSKTYNSKGQNKYSEKRNQWRFAPTCSAMIEEQCEFNQIKRRSRTTVSPRLVRSPTLTLYVRWRVEKESSSSTLQHIHCRAPSASITLWPPSRFVLQLIDWQLLFFTHENFRGAVCVYVY